MNYKILFVLIIGFLFLQNVFGLPDQAPDCIEGNVCTGPPGHVRVTDGWIAHGFDPECTREKYPGCDCVYGTPDCVSSGDCVVCHPLTNFPQFGEEDCTKNSSKDALKSGDNCFSSSKIKNIEFPLSSPISGNFTPIRTGEYTINAWGGYTYPHYDETKTNCHDGKDNENPPDGKDYDDPECADPTDPSIKETICKGVDEQMIYLLNVMQSHNRNQLTSPLSLSATAGTIDEKHGIGDKKHEHGFGTPAGIAKKKLERCFLWGDAKAHYSITLSATENNADFEGWPLGNISSIPDYNADCNYPCIPKCHDGIDNDLDGLVDCADNAGRINCQNMDPTCAKAGVENCRNNIDDDGDGKIDWQDEDCEIYYTKNFCLMSGAIVEVDNSGNVVSSRLAGPEDCTNGVDDDCDFWVDCGDPDCKLHPACAGAGPRQEVCDPNCIDEDRDGEVNEGCAEDCTDNWDNDCDGFVDCSDPDCSGSPDCNTPQEICDRNCADEDGDGVQNNGCLEICDDGWDNDCDGYTDNDDPECSGENQQPSCQKSEDSETSCSDNLDNDCDYKVDCADEDCSADPNCSGQAEICDADCYDEDNDGSYNEGCLEDCSNGIDDDCDGYTDNADSDCITAGREICNDSIDNDLDGKTDCEDEDCTCSFYCPKHCYLYPEACCNQETCSSYPSCTGITTGEDCFNGKDDDGDSLADCLDSDCCIFEHCQGSTACSSFSGEICDNKKDDDGDSLIDCQDTSDCCSAPNCAYNPDCNKADSYPNQRPTTTFQIGNTNYQSLVIPHIRIIPHNYQFDQNLEVRVEIRNNGFSAKEYALEIFSQEAPAHLGGKFLGYAYGAINPRSYEVVRFYFTPAQVREFGGFHYTAGIRGDLYRLDRQANKLHLAYRNEEWFPLMPQKVLEVSETHPFVILLFLLVVFYLINKKEIDRKIKKIRKGR